MGEGLVYVDIFADERKERALALFSDKTMFNYITESLWKELCPDASPKESHYPFDASLDVTARTKGCQILYLHHAPYLLHGDFFVLTKLPRGVDILFGKHWIKEYGNVNEAGSFVPDETLCADFAERDSEKSITERWMKGAIKASFTWGDPF
jgi:hypothetical protein